MRGTFLTIAAGLSLMAGSSFGQTISGVVNAAGYGHSAIVAPGSLISIFGSGLASGLSIANSVPISTTLGDVTSVTLNGTSLPLVFVSDGQINAQVPWSMGPGQANVVVNRSGGASPPMGVQVNPFAPALFGLNLGTLQAIAVNADGSLTAPSGVIPGLTSHPATAGDTVTFFATGLGPVDSQPPDGAASPDATRNTTNPATLLIGGAPGNVSFAGLSPQFVGVYQINVVVPGGVTVGGSVPVQVRIGGVTGPDAVTIALQ
jgi:uncharacterized protein (TIGR03437 family)